MLRPHTSRFPGARRGGSTAVLLAVLSLAGCTSSASPATTRPAATSTSTSTTSTIAPTTSTAPTTAALTTTVPTSTAPASTSPSTSTASAPTSTAPVTAAVLVYLVHDDRLVARGRDVAAATPLAAVQALLSGPTDAEASAGITTRIRPSTAVHAVTIEGDTATVDLSADFERTGTKQSWYLRVSQVVFTATQFPGITWVRFAIDGTVRTVLGSEQFDVTSQNRASIEDWNVTVPLILLEHPVDGAHVTQPIHISGVSNTFEAVVNYQLLDPTRKVLVEGNLMATSGTGTWGTFDADLAPLPAGTTGAVIVRVFEHSSADGTPVNVSEVTVTLSSSAPAATTTVLAYLMRNEHLGAVGRTVAAATPRDAVAALLAGPTPAESAAGFVTMIPSTTVLHGVTVAGSDATVDLSAAFGSGGGSLSMTGRVAELVFTVTQLPGIDTVHVALDGTVITMLSGEGLEVGDLTRATVEGWSDIMPLILLEHPVDGAHVTQPIHISGVSNTFEAVVNYQLLDPTRKVLVEGNLMATSGTGTWGTFDADLAPLPVGTTGAVIVRVFEYSSADGTPVNVSEVTVTV